MDTEIIKALVEGGIGMVAIVVIVWFYRNDNLKRDKQWAEHCEKNDKLWQEHCAMLKGFLEDKRALIEADQVTREGNTRVLSELGTLLKSLNGKVAEILAIDTGVKYGRRKDDHHSG